MIEVIEEDVVAIDLGGSKILAAIISNTGTVLAEECQPTLSNEGQEVVIKRIFWTTDRLLSQGKIDSPQLDSISIAAAGAIDVDRGLVTSSPNLPGWHNVPLRDIVREKYQVKTFLLNDANAAALGEQRLGVGRGVDNLIYLTVSTGIGGGIIINGELYCGVSGSAGEIGHMTIAVNGPRCKCGNMGCLEMLASGSAMAREAIRRIGCGEKSCLTELMGGQTEELTAEKVGVAARAGDALAREVILWAATNLGIGMVNLVNIFNPGMIIVGGGVAKLGELLLDPARQVVRERAFSLPAQAVRIVPTQLGDESGVLGAAIFAREQKTG